MALKNNDPSGGIQPKYILVAVLALGLVFFVMKGRTRDMAREKESSISQSTDPAPLPSDSDPEAYQSKLDQKRAQLAAKNHLGLKALKLKSDDGVVTIPFTFKPRKVWCQGGDIDTMKHATDNPAAKNMLISIEPLGGEGKRDSLRSSIADLHKGLEQVFKLKPVDEHRSYGLFICSDSKKEGSCKGKALKSHADISREAARSNAAKIDYIFYFQHIVLGKDTLEVYRTNDFSNQFKKSVENYLNSQRGIPPPEFQEAWKISELARSESADIQDGRILVSLAHNDPRCAAEDGAAK